MTRRPRLRKAGRIAGYAAAGLVAIGALIALGAPIVFRGARFGWLVERLTPEMRGHIHVGGGHWNWGTVISLARSRPAALAFEDVTITDPEGTEVLHIDHLSVRIEAHRRPTRIFVRDLVVQNARWRFANMNGEKKVGFLAALEGIPHAARKPSKPTTTEISIEKARLEGIETTFVQSSWGLVLRDVHASAGLALKNKRFMFVVEDADVRGGGRLRILGDKKGLVLPIDRGRLDRVATTADDPDSIQLDASGVATGASRISGGGRFTGIYGVTPASKQPGIDFQAHIANAADAINAIAGNLGLTDHVRVAGDGADVRLRFAQPFDRIAIDAEGRGLDVASGEIDARKVAFHLATEPQAGRVKLERLSLASPHGGHAEVSATLDRLQLDAQLTATRLAAGPLLPSALRPFVGGTLDGTLHARADLLAGDAELVRSTLVIARTESGKGPAAVALIAGAPVRTPPGTTVVRLTGAKLAHGVLRLPRVTLGMWGGSFAAAGRIALWDPDERRWLPAPRLDLMLQGDAIQIERVMGSNFAGGVITFRAHAHGTTDDLALDVAFPQMTGLTVLGEPVRLPAKAALRLRDRALAIASLPLGGPGSSVMIVAGRIALSGKLSLDVGVRQFPIARLPGILGTTLPVAGAISGAVRVVGEPRAPALTGTMTFADISYAGHGLGGGTITIAPEAKGAVRARGRVVDSIAIDGRLAPKPSGLDGDVTLTLARLPIEPFLPPLPGKLVARGVVSGTAVARIAPDHPATAEGRLSELSLSLTPPPARGRPAATFELHAENEVVLSARAGEGLTLGPTRLRSNLGTVEVAGQSHGDDLRASARGRLELGGLAAFARPWADRLAGAIDVDIAATGHGTFDDVSVSGSVVIAAPVSVKPASLPVEATIPNGRLRITRNVVETTALPVVVHAQRFPVGAVRTLDAAARISGRFDGTSTRGRFGARVALDRLDIDVPLVGPKPVHSAGGDIEIAGDAGSGKLEITRVDLPVVAEAEALAASAGAMVDRAAVALRVRGSSRQLALSGDVNLGSVHVRANALKSSDGAGKGGGSGGKGLLAGHPEIEAMRLDVRVRSSGGAVHVDVNNLPDLRLDVDLHVGGTAKKPSITGGPRGANLWSRFVLAVAGLFS